MKLARIFIVGMLISFVGSLPLVPVNAIILMLGINEGYAAGLWFGAGCIAIEIIYIAISLVMMEKLLKNVALVRILEWTSLVILVALAVTSLLAGLKNLDNPGAKILLSTTLPPFLLGVLMMAVNPAQFPFWFGWSTVLFTKKILLPSPGFYRAYVAGIAIGSWLGDCLYVFGGRLVADRLKANQDLINLTIGGILIVTAVLQLWKILQARKVAKAAIASISLPG